MPQPVMPAGRNAARAAPTIETAVCRAFALGWQMARLYESPSFSRAKQAVEDDLPGIGALSSGSRTSLGLEQIDEALKVLGAFLGAGNSLPATQALSEVAKAEPVDQQAVREAILTLHTELLVKLTAADARLGKSYGLGRALADTCATARAAHDKGAELSDDVRAERVKARLQRDHALNLVGWLDDLRTVLPRHAGHAVTASLERWIDWAEELEPAQMQQSIKRSAKLLHRQGQRWRAILSGEKACRDLLTIADYVAAGEGLLRRAGEIMWSFIRHLKVPLVFAAVLVAGGVTLVILDNSTSQVLAGLGTVAGGLGITWKSATTSLGNVSLRLGEPLWGAELDTVIAERVTSLPSTTSEGKVGV
jgi:hypothetical protein